MEEEECKKRGRPGLIHHMSGHGVDVGGGADIQICNEQTPKASFLPVKGSSFYHANVLSPELR